MEAAILFKVIGQDDHIEKFWFSSKFICTAFYEMSLLDLLQRFHSIPIKKVFDQLGTVIAELLFFFQPLTVIGEY